MQTIKLARQTLEKCSRHFTLLHLNLERAVIAYYLFIGRVADVETKMCKLYLQIQQALFTSFQWAGFEFANNDVLFFMRPFGLHTPLNAGLPAAL